MLSNQMSAAQNYMVALSKYSNELLVPFLISTEYFREAESYRLFVSSPFDTIQSYMELMEFNLDLISRCFTGTLKTIDGYNQLELNNAIAALINTYLMNTEEEGYDEFIERQAKMIDMALYGYPKAIQDIEPEFGFHFERGRDKKVAETDRFILYKVNPSKEGITIDDSAKPIIILPPYVLGHNILAFLPDENRSYTHCFSNQGIPTYIRVMKDISTTPALQTMTGEDDAKDTKYFCEFIKKQHGKPVTLNGYCQGGFSAVCDMLSGELDGLVDALMTCVSPMDGTRSKGLKKFLQDLPPRFNDLLYGTKTLSNGNKVADGILMGWVYKLKSIEVEAPVAAFYRDLMMFRPKGKNQDIKVGKSAAAINYWLQNERRDLPLSITDMSFKSYNIPITKDGTLPVKLFGKTLNFKRIKEKNIKWLICYGERDDLVETETALAPLDYIDAEISGFPKGHVAIATSWSDPKSACALHTVFGEKRYRGPVRFQMDLDEEIGKKK